MKTKAERLPDSFTRRRKLSVDVLGDAYMYLIKRFADENKGGTTAGQFYTPQEIVG